MSDWAEIRKGFEEDEKAAHERVLSVCKELNQAIDDLISTRESLDFARKCEMEHTHA